MLSWEARQYADLLFEGERNSLLREHDEAVVNLRTGLTNNADIISRVGLYNYVQPELSFIESVARSRARCLEVAYEKDGHTLTGFVIDQVVIDVDYQMEILVAGFVSALEEDAKLLTQLTGRQFDQTFISSVRREATNRRSSVRADIERELKVKLHEKQLDASRAL